MADGFYPPPCRHTSNSRPLHATAVGKALLSGLTADRLQATLMTEGLRPFTGRTIVLPRLLRQQLDAVRTDGVSMSHEEWRTGVCGVAAPVLISGEVVAAVGVVGSSTHLRAQQQRAPVRRAAVGLGKALERARGIAAA